MKKQSSALFLGIIVLVVVAGGLYVMKGRYASQASSSAVTGPPQAGAAGSSGGPSSFADMQKEHKYGFQLMKLTMNIERLEDEHKAELTPQQAKAILAILQPLREEKNLEESAASDAVTKIQDVLTDSQRAAISALPTDSGFHKAPAGMSPGGPSGAPQGAPAGPPPGGAGARQMDGFNPLNPPQGGPEGNRRGGKMNGLFKDLEKKSAG